MILTLMRHGEPVRPETGGEVFDPPLSGAGREALASSRALLDADGYEAVWTSPLARARQTAEIVAPGADLVVDDDLAEFDRGSRYLHWEDGREAYARYLDGDLSAWGTTLEEFRHRIEAVVERMRASAGGGRVLAVTHGGVINNFFSVLVGSPKVALLQPEYGSVNRFTYREDEGWRPVELNATPIRQ